jgi:hypothetical protein
MLNYVLEHRDYFLLLVRGQVVAKQNAFPRSSDFQAQAFPISRRLLLGSERGAALGHAGALD